MTATAFRPSAAHGLGQVAHPPGFYDIALRDFGLMVAALALGRVAAGYDPAWRRRRMPA